jgi:NAD(P) transhydrogenase
VNSAAAYDLVVIGSGPAGQKAAIAASKLGKKVAVVDRKEMVGGVCLHTGTIPSKTLREAILYLSGFREKSFYGRDYAVNREITVADLAFRVQKVLVKEMEVVRAQLARNHVTTVHGAASFVDPHSVEVATAEGATALRADYILVACGTRPAHDATVPLDGKRIIDSDQLLRGTTLPKDLIVVGAGVIGLEYASMITALSIKAPIIEAKPTILDFVDAEMIEALMYFMRQRGATFRLGEKVVSVGYDGKGRVVASLESGKEVHGDALLYTVGRQTNADLLNLAAAGLAADERGRIGVNAFYQTAVPHIYAAGDVIGFPALASTSMEQARVAMVHAFDLPKYKTKVAPIFPLAVYTIPEIAMAGETEESCRKNGIEYCVGRAFYRTNARGQIAGDLGGEVKLVFRYPDKLLLGVHIIGEIAAELVHVGLMALQTESTIDMFVNTVFNYPSLSDAYKYAAYDGLGAVQRRLATEASS